MADTVLFVLLNTDEDGRSYVCGLVNTELVAEAWAAGTDHSVYEVTLNELRPEGYDSTTWTVEEAATA